jgi:hypothetical protein
LKIECALWKLSVELGSHTIIIKYSTSKITAELDSKYFRVCSFTTFSTQHSKVHAMASVHCMSAVLEKFGWYNCASDITVTAKDCTLEAVSAIHPQKLSHAVSHERKGP